MMQKLLKENILSLVECRTWQSLPGNQLQSRQAWRHRPGGLGHRAALSCPEGGGGAVLCVLVVQSCFTSHPCDSWIREGRVPAVAELGPALSLWIERKRHRTAGVSGVLAGVPRGTVLPSGRGLRSLLRAGVGGIAGVSAPARLGRAPYPPPHDCAASCLPGSVWILPGRPDRDCPSTGPTSA